jgi:predicted adenylyl cyclase CyaB
MQEFELRFALSAEEYGRIQFELPWGPRTRVVDLTLGLSGATSMQTHGWVVRLRRYDAKVRLEFKGCRGPDWSSWTEHGTEVSDFSSAVNILTSIGLQPGLLLDRVRMSAIQDGVTYSLDDVRGLGSFIEIEVCLDDGNEADARRMVEQAQRRLSLGTRAAARPYGEQMLQFLNSDPEARTASDEAIRELLNVGQPV